MSSIYQLNNCQFRRDARISFDYIKFQLETTFIDLEIIMLSSFPELANNGRTDWQSKSATGSLFT